MGARRELDLVRLYLDEIGAVPLLTAAQEIQLAKRIEAGVYAAELLRRDRTGQETPAGRGRPELTAVAEDGRQAKNRMIRANLRLVVAVVTRYARRELPLLDAIQEGNIGLIRAVEKFDYTKGYKFSTYATWWIRQAVTRGVAQASPLRLPVYVMERLYKVERVVREFNVRAGHEPSVAEVATTSGIPAAQVGDLRRIGRPMVSLDVPLDHDGDVRLADVLADAEFRGIDECVEQRALAADVRAMVATLPAEVAHVIRQRFGLDGESRTLREVGDDLGLSRETVRRVERHGLAMLRENARRRVLLPWTG